MKRKEVFLVAAIIAGLFAVGPVRAIEPDKASKPASGDRILRKEIVIHGSLEKVWWYMTTAEGVGKIFRSEVKVELKPGGAWEFYGSSPDKRGKRGSEGSRILSFIPMEMLSFDWGFPPAVPTLRYSDAKTHTVWLFDKVDEGVRVRFAQLGWQKGEDWDKGYEYFDHAWTLVLNRLKALVEESKSADEAADPPKKKTWKDKHVKVTSIDKPEKRQEFEMIVPAPVEKVWSLLATSEGLMQLGGKKSLVELKPNGAYQFWHGGGNRVLSYLPMEMLSTSGSAPPQFPNVRKGGTWGAYFFEPHGANETMLRLVCIGWQKGEEWDNAFTYFLTNNPIFLEWVYKAATAPAAADAKAGADGKMPVHNRIYRSAGEKVDQTSHVAAFSRFMGGSWHSISKEGDGKEFHAKVVYEWGLDGKLAKNRSYVLRNGREDLVYETVVGWHPEKQKLTFRSFSSWDALYEGTMEIDGDAYNAEWNGYAKDGVTPYKQTIKFIDNDHYQWTVFTKTPAGWEQSKQTTFYRVKDEARTAKGTENDKLTK